MISHACGRWKEIHTGDTTQLTDVTQWTTRVETSRVDRRTRCHTWRLSPHNVTRPCPHAGERRECRVVRTSQMASAKMNAFSDRRISTTADDEDRTRRRRQQLHDRYERAHRLEHDTMHSFDGVAGARALTRFHLLRRRSELERVTKEDPIHEPEERKEEETPLPDCGMHGARR
jgi:hypothetical protein